MRTATVTYCGVSLRCNYEYSPAVARTWDEPGGDEDATLCECFVGTVDVLPMLTREQTDEIEALILQDRQSDADYRACEYADMKRDERVLERA